MASFLEGALSPWALSLDFHRILNLLAAFFLIYLALKVTRLYKRRKEMKQAFKPFPGPPVHWLLGNIQEFRQDGSSLERFAAWGLKYPYANSVWLGNYLGSLFITHPDYAKTIFSRSDPKDNMGYDFIVPWIGKGLLVLAGPKWFQHRRLLTPGFHFDVLKPYVRLISDSANVMLDKLERSAAKDQSVELFEHVSLMTLDSVMKCAFSYKSNCQKAGDDSYTKAVYDLSFLVDHRVRIVPYHSDLIYWLSPHGFRFRKACRIAHNHTEKVIRQRKELLKNETELEKIQQKRHLDFLDILLCARTETGEGLSDEDMRAEVDTFMFAGHDTTASGISWILYCMGKYPAHQEKCREEIKDILGDRKIVEWDDLSKMTYTTMFIKETLRLYPPVPGVARQLVKPVVFSDGRSLPEGSLVMISFYAIHQHPDFWKDPEVFDPLRFHPDNSTNRHSHAYMPFSAGSRNCIGQNFAMNEMKVAAALTLTRFKISLDETKVPIKVPQIILQSKNGIHVNLKRIQE